MLQLQTAANHKLSSVIFQVIIRMFILIITIRAAILLYIFFFSFNYCNTHFILHAEFSECWERKSAKTLDDLFYQVILLFFLPHQSSVRVFPMFLTHELRRLLALERALLAVGCTFWEIKVGRVHMVLIWKPTVNWLARYLLVPFPISTGDGHGWVRLQRKDVRFSMRLVLLTTKYTRVIPQ